MSFSDPGRNQKTQVTYLYLIYFPKFKMELSLLSTSYCFSQNIHINADKKECEYKVEVVMWFNIVKVSHSLSCLHTFGSLPQTLNQWWWFSLCTPNWSSRYSIRAIFKMAVFSACFFSLLIAPAAGVNFFLLFASLSCNFIWILFLFSHSIIIIHPLKCISTIISPLSLVFLHVGKIPYLSEDKTIPNVLSFMCYCVRAYREERL